MRYNCTRGKTFRHRLCANGMWGNTNIVFQSTIDGRVLMLLARHSRNNNKSSNFDMFTVDRLIPQSLRDVFGSFGKSTGTAIAQGCTGTSITVSARNELRRSVFGVSAGLSGRSKKLWTCVSDIRRGLS